MSKLLGEFLQEQQEPFALEVFLLERGYLRNNNSSSASRLAKFLNKSASNGLEKRKYAIPSCTKFVKAVFNQFTSSNDSEKMKNSTNGDTSKASRCQEETEEDDKLSIESSTSVSNSCPDSHQSLEKSYFLSEEEVTADRTLKWRAYEDNKQHSPVSVLDETNSQSDDGTPTHCKQFDNNTTQGESSTSFHSCKLKKPRKCGDKGAQELIGSKSSYHYMKNRRALQQKKQLLFDCVRDVVENHRKGDKRGENLKKIVGPEELWNNVSENVWLWSQESISESNIMDLLHFDFLASPQQWGDFQQQKRDISMEFGDKMLEDIINEIVENLLI